MRRIVERPHRLNREAYVGEITAAFTACIAGGYRGFLERRTVEPLIDYLALAADLNCCTVPIYCFMPDHLHVMLLGLEDHSDLLQAMYDFKHRSGQCLHRNHEPFRWQKDFYDHVVRGKADWRAQATYIAFNPVRAGIVSNLFDYPFTGSIGPDLQDVVLPW